MPVRYLREADVKQLLSMSAAIELVERALRDRAHGQAAEVARSKAPFASGTLRLLPASSSTLRRVGYKATYIGKGKRSRGTFTLLDSESGELCGIVESVHLSITRTGAASAVATRALARANARTIGQIGTGGQAMAQLEAVCHGRAIETVRVFARNVERLQAFCEQAQALLGVPVRAAGSVQEAVHGADIINVITNASQPVLPGALLEPGQHINAAGSNALDRRELDTDAVRRADVIVLDSRDGAREECGDLLPLVQAGELAWEALPELGDLLIDRKPGRRDDAQITLYESHGMGVQDLYAAQYVLQLAEQRNIGTAFSID